MLNYWTNGEKQGVIFIFDKVFYNSFLHDFHIL